PCSEVEERVGTESAQVDGAPCKGADPRPELGRGVEPGGDLLCDLGGESAGVDGNVRPFVTASDVYWADVWLENLLVGHADRPEYGMGAKIHKQEKPPSQLGIRSFIAPVPTGPLP